MIIYYNKNKKIKNKNLLNNNEYYIKYINENKI